MALITFESVGLSYGGDNVAHDVSFSVQSGEFWGIIGENGSGKTTLMKALLGLIPCASGRIVLGDGLKPNEIGYLPQSSVIQKDFPASVDEVVLSGTIGWRGMKPFYGKKERALARKNMEMLGILPIAKKSYQELSGGQQQRVLLARALCATRKCLVLDEPTTGLDPVVTAEFYRLLNTVNQNGMTIIMVSHDVEEAVRSCTHILHLSCHPLYIGTAAEYKNSPIGRKYLKETAL
ncbi:MAG: metal ABC transporter ATP-binding protein [Clostridia bacterium]|nr:metal ABC transporter ATP-binding protein [Clostridia bacterium]